MGRIMKHVSSFLPYYLLLLFGLIVPTLGTSDEQFVFSGFTQSSLTLEGSAMVTQDGLLDLSNGSATLRGHAFYPTPLHFRKSPIGKVQSFSVSIIFGIANAYPDLSADGMAFFIAPTNNISDGMPGRYFGLLNENNDGNTSNHIFLIEFDTFQNLEIRDINDNHIGIGINSISSFNSSMAGFYEDKSGVFKNLTLNSDKEMQLWVEYEERDTEIKLTLAPLHVGKPLRPLLSATYDLSTVLTDTAYIGFSSSAEPMNTRHYIIGWSFGMNIQAPSIDNSKLPKLRVDGSKAQSDLIFEIILPTAATAALILAAIILVIRVMHRRLGHMELHEDWEVEFGPHRFSYKDLFQATQGFKNKHLLGAGGFGKVYKGLLPVSKLQIAVKRLSHESRQGMKEFITEVVSIGRLRHRNLVQLLGYCRRKGELLLVYDYMPNGSLDKYIHCGEDKPTLNWNQRFRIMKGIATGLLYLHEKWEKIVIHRDIKASNVLLDGEMNGRLGDFGLARLYDHGTEPHTTRMVGTVGYLAPELLRTGKASPQIDVFAFGMFLLEVTCGQRPIQQNTEGNQVFLVDWVLEHWNNGSLSESVDIRLQGNYNIDEACLVLKLGLLCMHPFPSSRPRLRQVMQYLDGDMPLPELKSTQLSLNMLVMTQNNGFDPSVMSYPQLMSSFGAMSDLSGGR